MGRLKKLKWNVLSNHGTTRGPCPKDRTFNSECIVRVVIAIPHGLSLIFYAHFADLTKYFCDYFPALQNN